MAASAAAFAADFDKTFGGNDESATVTEFIDTGFSPLNEILCGDPNGGLPQGRIVEMFGESSTGKTALATEWMGCAQKMGGAAAFIDWERSFSQDVAQKGFGVTTELPLWLYKKPKTWEEGNQIALTYMRWLRDKKVIDPKAPILIVMDSIASAVPKEILELDLGDHDMRSKLARAAAVGVTLPVMAQQAEEYNATLLYLNQMRLKPGVVYGDPRTTPGGKATEFYCTSRLALGRKKVMKQVDGVKEFVGQEISIQSVKSKLTRPFQECELRLSFDEQGVAHFDKELSTIETLIKRDILKAPRNGFVEWNGKQIGKQALADELRASNGLADLRKLFPTA